MATNKESKNIKIKEASDTCFEPPRPRTRIREVNFMRVEDTQGQVLSAFELEVKEKIACVSSPYEELAQKEEKKEKREKAKRTLAKLLKSTKLTPNQKTCYELSFIEELPDSEVAARLSVSASRVRSLKSSVISTFRRTQDKFRRMEFIARAADSHKLSPRQQLIWKLCYESHLWAKEIASKLGTTEKTVEMVLRRLRKKIFPRGISEKRGAA